MRVHFQVPKLLRQSDTFTSSEVLDSLNIFLKSSYKLTTYQLLALTYFKGNLA
jgi:hypothetical protein